MNKALLIMLEVSTDGKIVYSDSKFFIFEVFLLEILQFLLICTSVPQHFEGMYFSTTFVW